MGFNMHGNCFHLTGLWDRVDDDASLGCVTTTPAITGSGRAKHGMGPSLPRFRLGCEYLIMMKLNEYHPVTSSTRESECRQCITQQYDALGINSGPLCVLGHLIYCSTCQIIFIELHSFICRQSNGRQDGRLYERP